MITTNGSTRSDAPVVVIGATGRQGNAVVSALLERGQRVRALVRDHTAERAQSLARAGAELVTADLNDSDTLIEALRGAPRVFAMTTFTGPDGPDGEVRHGQILTDAMRNAGVDQVVFSSVGGAERATGVPHFESKRRVEEFFEASGLRTTFIRPTFFMDNFTTFSQPVMEEGTLVVRLPLPEGIPLQMVSVRDIGQVAAAALIDPNSVPGGAVEIAGDELTGEQIASAFSTAWAVPARYEAVPVEALGDDDQEKMFAWFTRLPAYRADWTLTRQLVPDVQDLHTWLKGQEA